MKIERRKFLQLLSSFGLVSGLPVISSSNPNFQRLNILVLGGTNFLGPAIVNAAIKQGHKVTLFNRQMTNPHLFTQAKKIKGDRQSGLNCYKPLLNIKWDAVIDVWPEKSQLVSEASMALQKHAEHYVFISSIAVYRNFQEVGLHENSQVIQPGSDSNDWYYPEEKWISEEVVRSRFASNHTVLRPGPITGWRDPALDLLYWLIRLKANQDVLAPGSGNDPLQFIDVKDIGAFAIRAIENKLYGTFNCTGPAKDMLVWNEFLNKAKAHLNSTSELHWASEAFLRDNGVRSFDDLPLWAPLTEDKGFMQISAQKAIDSGFIFTKLTQTLDDTLNWFQKNWNSDFQFAAGEESVGLDRIREEQLIQKWKKY